MAIALDEVIKRFGTDTAVDGVSLEIDDEEFFVVLGPSGCGKTTLLRLIAGLETLDAGRISIGGTGVAGPAMHMSPEDRNVGVVFQSYALWPHMSVRANVAFPMESAGMKGDTVGERADDCLRTVELTGYADRKPAELSGGQRQRVALARCLAQAAGTILMDEPLANLDPHLRSAMEEELAAFHASSGATTLYITHDQREAMALASRIAIMWDGKVLQVDTPERLYRRPNSERVARFIGRGAIADAEVQAVSGTGASLRLGETRIDGICPAGIGPGPARIVIRPEDIVPAGDGTGVPAHIERITYRGGFWEAHARLAGLADPVIVNLADRVAPGETLHLAIRAAWVLGDRDTASRVAA